MLNSVAHCILFFEVLRHLSVVSPGKQSDGCGDQHDVSNQAGIPGGQLFNGDHFVLKFALIILTVVVMVAIVGILVIVEIQLLKRKKKSSFDDIPSETTNAT